MTQQDQRLMPTLTSFLLPNVPFAVVDPRELPETIQSVFEAYLAGSAVPHPIYVYQHDYERFCLLVQQNKIQIQ
ncbi:hypothetical protein ABMY36_12555 [Vibrio vulnificus]|uniref:hypothetical protein n=1 Tax=Vibrio vulnificus TaxID=672 RepID=UPI001A2FB976|nr:hypothetical protein [Vibrio vulnificus]EJO9873982.1 hypothetical protein [Vibrio vulnificus]ELK8309863.1 hypothetical protein [Vibrio vulnificus]ELS0760168.1 hypothetical protein [Vibrio vulnificus]HAS8515209.1 hypothetical protein [Vibrio vulnificus]